MSELKVFNQGSNTFKVWGLEILPNRFTAIPEEMEHNGLMVRPADHVRKLMKDYPNELVTDKAADTALKAQQARIRELEEQLGLVREENKKLKQMLSGERSAAQVDTLGNDLPPPEKEPKATKGKK